MTVPAQKQIHRLSDFVIEEVSLVDRAANKRRFIQFKRDTHDNEHDMQVDNIPLQQRADGSFETAAPADAPKGDVAKGMESVEDLYYTVGDAVDRLMRVASVTLQADALKLDSGPNAQTVVAEIEAVQSVLNSVKEKIAAEKAIKAAKSEDAPAPVQTEAPKTESNDAVAKLEDLAKQLTVEKAGAAMSSGRLKRFTNALSQLAQLLSEVGGDAKSLSGAESEKAVKTEAPAAVAPAIKAESADAAALKAEVAKLRRENAVLKREPAASQSLPVEKSNPQAGNPEDYAWPADMNKPLGRNDVPVEKSFY